MYKSETFGRIFWIDDDYEFKSFPLNVDQTGGLLPCINLKLSEESSG